MKIAEQKKKYVETKILSLHNSTNNFLSALLFSGLQEYKNCPVMSELFSWRNLQFLPACQTASLMCCTAKRMMADLLFPSSLGPSGLVVSTPAYRLSRMCGITCARVSITSTLTFSLLDSFRPCSYSRYFQLSRQLPSTANFCTLFSALKSLYFVLHAH